MLKLIAVFLFSISLSCCHESERLGCHSTIQTEEPQVIPLAEHQAALSDLVQAEGLSLVKLIGKWLLLDAEGEVDGSGDYLLISENSQLYNGMLKYQGFIRHGKLVIVGEEYFIASERGEKYKLTRIESTHRKEHNGIGLSLVTGFDDISLGYFQHENIIEKLNRE